MSNATNEADGSLMKQMAILEDMYAPEDLHPDLVPYLSESDLLSFQILCHPLVYSVPYMAATNKQINRRYAYLTGAVEKALRINDIEQYVFMHERPYRLQAFISAHCMDNKQYWSILGVVWRDSENIYQNAADWAKLWRSKRSDRSSCMEENDHETLDKLPDTFAVYRGFQHNDSRNGMSWTLDRDQAIWFAKRGGCYHSAARLAAGTVNKKDVLAYFGTRSEQEIIVIGKKVMDVTISKLEKF